VAAPLALLKGTLAPLILKTLTWQPMHGFEITSWLEARARHRLALEDAVIYQALYRLEEQDLVRSEWGVTEERRRARFYTITGKGRRELAKQTADWLRYAETVTALLTAAPERG
jgi:transcriptional regulator